MMTTSAQGFTVTIEKLEVQNKPTKDELFVVDLNNIAVGSTESISKFDSINSSTYSYNGDLKIRETNIYGGAEVSYYYIELAYTTPSSFNIAVDQKQKYFGFW